MQDTKATDFTAARIYTDFSGLSSLKRAAANNSPEAAKEVAKQFESILMGIALKAMREANEVFRSDLLGGSSVKFYEEMFDNQLTLHMSEGHGFGLQDSIYEQLVQYMPKDKKSETKTEGEQKTLALSSSTGIPLNDDQKAKLGRVAGNAESTQVPQVVQEVADKVMSVIEGGMQKIRRFNSSEEFIQSLLPIAAKHAKKIGVDPRLLVAQAALESGWGRSMISGKNGENSHNLFGIKSHGWQGDNVRVATHEYRDGQRVKEYSDFRSYQSYDESFADYVSFLQDNPRYKQALQQSSDPAQFARELQKAGYATDPNYAGKIMRIMNSIDMQHSGAGSLGGSDG